MSLQAALPRAPLPAITVRFTVDADGRYAFVRIPRRAPGAWMTMQCRDGLHDACRWVLGPNGIREAVSPPCGCTCGHNAAWIMPKRDYTFAPTAEAFGNPVLPEVATVAPADDSLTMGLFA